MLRFLFNKQFRKWKQHRSLSFVEFYVCTVSTLNYWAKNCPNTPLWSLQGSHLQTLNRQNHLQEISKYKPLGSQSQVAWLVDKNKSDVPNRQPFLPKTGIAITNTRGLGLSRPRFSSPLNWAFVTQQLAPNNGVDKAWLKISNALSVTTYMWQKHGVHMPIGRRNKTMRWRGGLLQRRYPKTNIWGR